MRIEVSDGSVITYDIIEPLNANGLVSVVKEGQVYNFEPTSKYNLNPFSAGYEWEKMKQNNSKDFSFFSKGHSALNHYATFDSGDYGLYQGEIDIAFEAATAVLGALSAYKVLRTSRPSSILKIPCGCFTAGTVVKTSEGDENIEEIKVGDLVWAFDDSTGAVALKKVLHLYNYDRDTVYKIYSSNDVVETTSEHPFFVRGQYLAAKHLTKGDSLLLQSGKHLVVDSIIIVAGNYLVYNFTVDDYHTYFVGENGILVHNTPCPYKLSNKTVQTEIDALGKDLSTKRLEDVDADLLKSGWTKTSDKGITRYTLEVPMENGYNKKYILDHNSTGTTHSINGQDVQYWKLYQDKTSSKKVLFRGSNDTNFKSGGHGDTFINGAKVE